LRGAAKWTITARPVPNAAPARLKVRKNTDSLSAQELADFRRAVKQAQPWTSGDLIISQLA
jgi:hypothetical protein